MIKRCIVILFILLMAAQTVAAMPLRQDTDRIQVGGKSLYLLGLNYPWVGYGHDFGTTAWGHDGVSSVASTAEVEADFADMKSLGVRVVRWFLFCDGRASPEFDETGLVTGFDDYFYADFNKALEIAQKNDIYLLPVLWDFHLADSPEDINGVQQGGRAGLITDSAIQQSFLDNALKPLLEQYGQNPTIIAWEVINEPEGAMQIDGGNWVGEAVTADAMQTFVGNIVSYIHTYSSQDATLGSASRGFLFLWTGSNLDFYQYHYYDHMEGNFPFDYPATELKLDKPVIVGEFPTANTSRTLTQYLDTIWQNGYAGAMAWSYRADDDATGFKSKAAEFSSWAESHQNDIAAVVGGAEAEPTDESIAPLSKFDFESDVMGWYSQDWVDSMACTGVGQSDLYFKDGRHSLVCDMNLIGGDPNFSKGEALVDLQYQAERQLVLPSGITAESIPLNLEGHTITIWVYAPKGSRGYRDMPNGFQVFVKDVLNKGEYGIWHNIVPENEYIGQRNAVIEEQWSPVTLTVSPESTAPRGFWVAKGFDPTQIIIIGLKMGAADGSAAQYQGPIYIDAVDWN